MVRASSLGIPVFSEEYSLKTADILLTAVVLAVGAAGVGLGYWPYRG